MNGACTLTDSEEYMVKAAKFREKFMKENLAEREACERISIDDFNKAVESLRKANIPPPYRLITSNGRVRIISDE